jgi:hypothetical protein
MNELETKNTQIEVESEVNPESSSGPVAMVRHDFVPPKITLRSLRAETEMQAISQALEQTGWNRKRAAQLLSISYRGLLYKIRQHNITKTGLKGNRVTENHGTQNLLTESHVTQNQGLAGVPKRTQMADTLGNWETPGLAVAGGGTPGKD